MDILGPIGTFLGTLFGPIGQVFHYLFYEPVFNVLMLIYQGVHAIIPAAAFPSFAVAILLLTVLIRLCLFPLTRKQLESSRAMQALAPQIQEIKRRYPNSPQEQMAAQQALYREHGVSMYGGCLPLLIQLPFLYALYYSFSTALLTQTHNVGGHPVPETPAAHLARINRDIYPFLPHLTQLPNTHFLWTNLAVPDPWHILPILAGVLTFIQLRMAQPVRPPQPPGQRADPSTQSMKTMQYIMPVFTAFIGLNFPAGLAFYWCISTAFSAVQQYLLTGWGSLFLGIPGLEHLVPEPQSAPALAGKSTASSSSSRVVDADPQSGRPTGLGGFRELLRQLTAPPQNAANAASLKEDMRPAGGANGSMNGTSKSVSGGANAANGATSSQRRQRAERSEPMLVKPPTSSPAGGASGSASAGKSASSPTKSSASGGNGSGASGRPAGGQSKQAGRRRSGGRPKGGR